MISLDTLSYKYVLKSDKSSVFKVLVDEQLQYFQKNDPKIISLEEGTSVQCNLTTKLQSLPVSSVMEITKLKAEETLQTKTSYSSGMILQMYEFKKDKKGKDILIYSEKNTFSETRNQYGFMLIGFFYKLFYNRGIAKRMRYIDNLSMHVS
ncbi:MAG: DUF3284 domain-containing protein [Carnobacterium inhibens]|uniref:DUF3284 domain-containing protein n=1 Tax=Carnobacterium TaxID=2747 RepID=UPI00054FF3AB|nr:MULTISPECIES: DUF3284 domain-containing protein [Carnobacterium]MCM3512127.1 DUF3284 domain-containing protein [Carnobacterium inhibens]MDN5372176.1 hypothetical protein [Carnobacterium sp.]